MKRVFNLLVIFVEIIFISGCSVPLVGQKVTKCTLDNDQSKSGYKTLTTYNIYSKKNIVTKVSYEEVLSSENTTILKYFEDLNKKQFETQNNTYGGYTFDIKSEKNKVISKVTINYNKLNLEKFIKDNSAMKSYVNKDNKFTLEGAKTMYESLGAKCK